MPIRLKKQFEWEDLTFLFALVIACSVFIYHLGLMPLLDDEPTRALVSLEMVLSDNYIVPTTHGLLYQNKPPLFNWFIASLMQLNQPFSEFHLRLPSMLAFLLTATFIYCFFKKELNKKTALITAFAYLTCGRILFYDSMLGYIDPIFTLVLFFDVLVLYQFVKTDKVWWIFIVSYLLCLLAYLLKGLPGIVFHGFTLLAALFISKKLNKLFSPWHFVGIALFLSVLIAYYTAYAKEQELSGLFATLWDQSTKRTVTEFTWMESLEYILTFPFQFILHFLPWTLVVFVLFNKRAIGHIKRHRFLAYCNLVFLCNISVYWISPETKPRYIFLLLPLFFAVTLDSFFATATQKSVRIFYKIILGLSLACGIAVLAPLFLPVLQTEYTLLICLLTFTFIAALVMLMYYKSEYSLVYFTFVLFCIRLSFNHFILPARKTEAPETTYKNMGIKIGALSQNKDIHILDETGINHDLAYYISATNRKILKYEMGGPITPGDYYICSNEVMKRHNLMLLFPIYASQQTDTLLLAQAK